MIADLKPYPATKDSGLAWLGEVPEHWEVGRAKTLLHPVDVRSETGEEELLTVSSARGVIPRRTASVTMFKAESYVGHKLCWPGDLVINSLWAWSRGLGVSRHHGIVSTAYGVYRSRTGSDFEAQFLDRLVRSTPFQWELQVRSKGVWKSRLQLTDESFLGAPLPRPPLPEQAAIVRYLDHVDRRIHHAIGAKQRLIALLEEQKQAIIHRAVTRGLDPDVRLKPSGVEWLGDIPERWSVTRIKNEFECLNRRRIPLSSTERGEMTSRRYDYYGASGVIDRVDDFLFDEDLLLIAEDGANLVLRNLPLAIVARGKYWVNNHAHILRPRRGNLEFFAALLETIDFRPWISGAAQPKLTKDRLLSIAIATPAPGEQSSIMKSVERETADETTAIARAKTEVALLREYRTRLISDVVTGKLDVREAAADLPEIDDADLEEILEVEEPATEDELIPEPEGVAT
jgi:type I restriction enzyme, S subunit